MKFISPRDASLLSLVACHRRASKATLTPIINLIEDEETRGIATCLAYGRPGANKVEKERVAAMLRWVKSLSTVHAPPSRRKR